MKNINAEEKNNFSEKETGSKNINQPEELTNSEIDVKYIFESPDKGKTIYRRKFGEPHDKRELISNG